MQGIATLPPVVAASRGFPINGDDVGGIVAQVADPGQEAGFEQFRVQRREYVTQRVMARDAALEAVETSEERQMLRSPECRLNEIVRAGDRRTQNQKQNFW